MPPSPLSVGFSINRIRACDCGAAASLFSPGTCKMADIKSGDPFGMEEAYLVKIDWDLARRRILQDVRSDFIYAPHLNFIYSKAGNELVASGFVCGAGLQVAETKETETPHGNS